MINKIIDKISMILLGTLILTLGYFAFEWLNNGFKEHKSWVYSVDINDDDIIASTSENKILLWDGLYNTETIEEHTKTIRDVAFSNGNSLIASGGDDKKVKIWSLSENKVIKELDTHPAEVSSVQFSAKDNYVIFTGYDHKLHIWDWKKNSIIKNFDVKKNTFSISHQNILTFTDNNCNIILFSLNDLSVKNSIENYCDYLGSDPTGNFLANRGKYEKTSIIDSNTGEKLAELDLKYYPYHPHFAFIANSNILVVDTERSLFEIWDWRTNKLIKKLSFAYLNSVNDFSFSQQGLLLTASGDSSVKIWNINTGDLVLSLGDGLYQTQLLYIIAFLILAVLSVSFIGIYQDSSNKYSNWSIKFILTFWTCGIFLIILPLKSHFSKTAISINWVFTILSGLSVLSLYYFWLTVFTIPISLSMGYMKLKATPRSEGAFIPVIINFVLAAIIFSW